MTFIITQKNPPAYPLHHSGEHQCAVNEKAIEGYRYSVECNCGWRVHAGSADDARFYKQHHESESRND